MHGPLTPNHSADRPRPISVREGRRANLIYLLHDFGLAGERRGQPSEQIRITRSLVHPGVASRKPRPKVVAAPPVATFLLVDFPRRGQEGGDKTTTQKN
jgi:hypothetical protein